MASNSDLKIEAKPSAISDLRIEAKPSAISEGFTKHLSLNCSYHRSAGSDFSTLMSLILSKAATAQDTDFKYVYKCECLYIVCMCV